jgi:hypothetical protein
MVAFKLQNFGGQIPAVDDRLLPQDAAALAQNAWIYTGALEGMRTERLVYTASSPTVSKVYRIPKQYYDKEHIFDSYWLEFIEPNTDVVHSPTVGDQYERYYWASSQRNFQFPPYYNTKDRIAAGQSPFLLGIPAPTQAPAISVKTGTYTLTASYLAYNVAAYSTNIYHKTNFEVDSGTFATGIIDVSSQAIQYHVQGFPVQMRHKTVSGSNQVTIDDQGRITIGVPPSKTGTATTGTTPIPGSWAYVYTWVSAYGEESAPSPASTFNGNVGDTRSVRLTAPTSAVTTNRNITKARIYRTVTGQTGAATYFFVDEIPISQTLYSDAYDDATISLNNQLQSLYWTPPPSDLEGMITMPNGIVAGFRKNEIWFCEPYHPHAWPSIYTISTEYPIVGLGVTGQTLIVCTTGFPYAVTGVVPANMSMSRVATYEPCLSRSSIVSSVDGVYYASPNGLVRAFGFVFEVTTRTMITKDHWLDYLSVPYLWSARLNNGYYTWGSIRPGCFEGSAFEKSAFLEKDYTGAYNGALIDLNDPRISWMSLYNPVPVQSVFADYWTGEVFICREGGLVYWFDLSSTNPHGAYKWRSKIFEMPNKRNLEAMRIYWGKADGNSGTYPTVDDDDYDINMEYDADDPALVRVYADGNLVLARVLRTSGEMIRIPSGFKSIYWQIEIEGIVPIYSVEIATSAKELSRV